MTLADVFAVARLDHMGGCPGAMRGAYVECVDLRIHPRPDEASFTRYSSQNRVRTRLLLVAKKLSSTYVVVMGAKADWFTRNACEHPCGNISACLNGHSTEKKRGVWLR